MTPNQAPPVRWSSGADGIADTVCAVAVRSLNCDNRPHGPLLLPAAHGARGIESEDFALSFGPDRIVFAPKPADRKPEDEEPETHYTFSARQDSGLIDMNETTVLPDGSKVYPPPVCLPPPRPPPPPARARARARAHTHTHTHTHTPPARTHTHTHTHTHTRARARARDAIRDARGGSVRPFCRDWRRCCLSWSACSALCGWAGSSTVTSPSPAASTPVSNEDIAAVVQAQTQARARSATLRTERIRSRVPGGRLRFSGRQLRAVLGPGPPDWYGFQEDRSCRSVVRLFWDQAPRPSTLRQPLAGQMADERPSAAAAIPRETYGNYTFLRA